MLNASFVNSLSPQLLSLMRLIIAFLFMQHGSQKLFNYPVPMPGPPLELFSLIGLAGVLEFFGGLLLLVGLFTRWTAFILSGLMAFAYFIGHAGKGFWPLANQGELAVAYCFVFLYLAAAGGGPWSIDRLRGEA